jgi:tetratricopeptide (TPR) repeat protein
MKADASSHGNLKICFFLAGITFFIFSPALSGLFVGLDDFDYVLTNPYVQKGLSGETFGWAFSFYASNWHPLTWLSHLADVHIYGLNPRGHHLTSLLLHCANVVLLFLAMQRITQDRFRAALVAALFALHPLRVESVAWISERKDVLSAFFGLAALLRYADYVRKNTLPLYLQCLGLFALSLMAKPMLISWPLILLFLDYWPLKRFGLGKRIVFEKIPFFALSFASGWITVLAQTSGSAVMSTDYLPMSWRIPNALVSYVQYLWKTVLPYPLYPFYVHPFIHPSSASHYERLLLLGVLAAIVLIVASWAVFVLRKKQPHLITGWLWYGVMLFPAIGVVQVGSQAMADRYTYLPLVGIFIMAVWSIPSAGLQLNFFRKKLMFYASAYLILCSILTWNQIQIWKNSERLFSHILKIDPDNYMGFYAKGGYHVSREEWEKASDAYLKAIEKRPEYADSYFYLAVCYNRLGRPEDARRAYEKVTQWKDPRNANALINVGTAYREMGDVDNAVSYYFQALRYKPVHRIAQTTLGNLLNDKGIPEGELYSRFEIFFREYDYPRAFKSFYLLLEDQKRYEDIIEILSAQLLKNPTDLNFRFYRALTYKKMKKYSEAKYEFEEILRLSPGHAKTEAQLAEVKELMKQ